MNGKLYRAIAEAEKESQSQELLTEVYVRERRALDEQIPAVWAKLKAAVRSKCEATPKHFLFMVCPDTEAKVERLNDAKHRMLEMELLRESGIVEFNCGSARGCFTIRLNRQNIAGVCDQDGGAFASLEDATDEVLTLLFS
jgi:hypothetical protein